MRMTHLEMTDLVVGEAPLPCTPSEILAAFLCAQLEARERIQDRRRLICNYYHDRLAGWARDNGVRVPFVPVYCEHPYHMFYLVMPSLQARTALIERLKARGILAVFHYLPLHLSEVGRRFGGKEGDCPVTEAVSDRLVRLPMFWALTDAEIDEVVAAVKSA